MPALKVPVKNKQMVIIAVIAFVLVALSAGFWFISTQTNILGGKPLPAKPKVAIKPETVIDLNQLAKDKALSTLAKERKSKYGVEEGVDIIVKSDESIKVGRNKVAMQEIIEKIKLHEGEVIEKDINPEHQQKNKPTHNEFGIYVIQPDDNIWNLHFNFLKDYFGRRGITVSSLSDEPHKNGRSSGVGKLLKFSESKVYIYNLQKRQLDIDLSVINPNDKILIYNMKRIFNLLDQVEYDRVNHIHFDGETLWIAAEN